MNRLRGLEAQPEDVFREVAYMFDYLLSAEGLNQQRVDGLWVLLVNDIRIWKPDVQEADKMLMAGTVFSIVKKILCHHSESRYCETIHDMLDVTIEKELSVPDEQEHQQFLDRLSECSVMLSEWVNQYEDSDEWLSEEIGSVLAQPKIEEGLEQKEQGGQGTRLDEDIIKAEKAIRGLFPSDVEGKQYERFMRAAQGKEKLALARTLKEAIGYSRGNATKKVIHWALGRLGFVVGSYSNFKL